MPIEFRCPACGKLLRTPEGSEGKQARCPGCGGAATVPSSAGGAGPGGASGEGGPASPGEGFSQPVGADPGGQNPFFSSAGGGSPGAEPLNPYAAPQSSSLPPPSGFQPSLGVRTGPAWEREPRSFSSFWQTVKDGFDPNKFFDDMRREGGLGPPMTFAVIGGSIGMIASLCYNFGIQALMVGVGANQGGGAANGAEIAGGMAAMALGFVVCSPIFIILGLYINSGLYHLGLRVLKGANYPFETTFRVVAYSTGIMNLLMLIPFIGGIAGIVQLVWVCIGLTRAHETSGGKAVGAVLLPIVVIICCVIAAAGAVIAIVASQQR